MFDAATQVHTPYGVCEIEYLDVGSLVLSRCSVSGAQGYRRVTSKTIANCPQSCVVHLKVDESSDFPSAFGTTVDHLIWVNGFGWIQGGFLAIGHQLEIVDPIAVPDEYRPESQKKKRLALGGGRWQARVTRLEIRDNRQEHAGEIFFRDLYNIEVEEFNTFFVDWYGVWVRSTPRSVSFVDNSSGCC